MITPWRHVLVRFMKLLNNKKLQSTHKKKSGTKTKSIKPKPLKLIVRSNKTPDFTSAPVPVSTVSQVSTFTSSYFLPTKLNIPSQTHDLRKRGKNTKILKKTIHNTLITYKKTLLPIYIRNTS